MAFLTSDNPSISEPKTALTETARDSCEINFTLDEDISDLVRDSLAPNSRRAYASDLARFTAWGGTIPADSGQIARYLADHSETHATSTLARWLTSLAKAHRAAALSDPTKDELVHSVLRGIRRRRHCSPAQAKPFLRDDLLFAIDATRSE